MAKLSGIEDSECGEIVRTNISVAYPLGQLGNFFVYLFVVFALFYHGVVAEPLEISLLPLISLLSSVGSPTSSVDAVSFLSQWLGLPDQTTSLYVSLMTLTRYGQVIASVAGFAFLSFGVVLCLLWENSHAVEPAARLSLGDGFRSHFVGVHRPPIRCLGV